MYNYCGMDVIKIPLFKSVQVRTHRKKRINKKWCKKYGMKSIQARPVMDHYYTGLNNKIFIPEELWDIFMAAVNLQK